MKTLKITIAILALGLVGFAIYAVTSYHEETKVKYDTRANYLHEQEAQILFALRRAGTSFADEITLIEHTDSEGNYYYVGEISPELDPHLGNLVDAYNADPETTMPITLQELRYCLTDGLAEATEKNKVETSFRHFLKWCGIRVDVMNNDGTLNDYDIRMFDYIRKKDATYADCYIVKRPQP